MKSWMPVAALALALTVAPQVRADEPKEAVERFERGVLLYQGGSPDAALVEFEAAHRLTGNYRILYNIALCRAESKDYVGAISTYTRYLAEGGERVDRGKRADVSEQIRRLTLFTGRVSVRTDAPASAEIWVDDRRAGAVPLTEPLTVNVGARKLSVHAGGRVASKTVLIVSGEQAFVDLPFGGPLAPTASAPRRDAAPPADAAPAFPWPFWAATGAFGAGAAVTGVLAVGRRNDAARTQATFGARREDIAEDQTAAERLGLATDVLLGASVVSAALGTYFTVRHLAPPGDAAKRPAVRATFGPRGLLIEGTM
ncbi:MAG: hypothetical protein MUF34_22885 [Polyangiaceae bacterium]|nr:hypothetical protein [Polyangiaceae bacterium]